MRAARTLRTVSWLALVLGALVPPARGQAVHRVERVRAAMGTTFGIVAYGDDSRRLEAAAGAALDQVERLDALLSHYRPDSALGTVNREAGRGPVRADPELFGLIERCQHLSAETRGAFDITVGPLMRAWGFPPVRAHRPTLAEARAAVGFRKLRLDESRGTVTFEARGMELDLGGVGKGYAVDRAVAILRAAGVRTALVNAGGSTLYGLGSPPAERAWRVTLDAAADGGSRAFFVRDEALSMSGRLAQSVSVRGRRIGHVFDPRSGGQAAGADAIAVTAPDATLADALDNAFLVLGRDERAQVAAHYPGVEWWEPAP